MTLLSAHLRVVYIMQNVMHGKWGNKYLGMRYHM